MAIMYEPLVILHSWLRWVVLLLALLALGRAIAGWSGGRPWTPADDAAGKWFTIALDLQVLIGLVLYVFLSPHTLAALGNLAETMRDSASRFWAVEHLVGMIAGAALVHVGRVRVRKTPDSRRRHTLALVFFGLALVVIAATIPWPFVPAARPLFRGF